MVRVRLGAQNHGKPAEDQYSKTALEPADGSLYSPENDPHLAMSKDSAVPEVDAL